MLLNLESLREAITELTARADAQDDRIAELEGTIDELRVGYAASARPSEDDYDYYVDDEWEAL